MARENHLENITIDKKLPPPIGESFWATAPRDGFTAYCAGLFERRRPQTSMDIQNSPKRRASDYDRQ